MADIMVSIVCNTYNHKKYIRDALEGFLMQKTEFAFEILVHDDASPDGTADIIREYEQKYPELIKPIYQTENQYSQKKSISATFQYPRVRGKYIAFCEGDDFWTDDRKLQKQVDALEVHPEVDICAHRAQTMRDGEIVGTVAPSQEDCIFTPEQVITGSGGFVATASLMFRSTMIETYRRVLGLDYAWQIYGSLRGGMLYLEDTMSVYRLSTEGSWTVRTEHNAELRKHHFQRVEQMLRKLDEETQGKFSNVIHYQIVRRRVFNLLEDGEFKQILLQENRPAYKRLPFKQRVKVRLFATFPWLGKCWRNLRKKEDK